MGAVARRPECVVFKGDNGQYLAASSTEGYPYLQFNKTDVGIGEVRFQVVDAGKGPGIVMLKCLHWDKFWRRSPNWIWADTANANSSDNDLLFKAVKVDDQRVALRSLGNDAFCKRLITEGKMDCLSAGTRYLESSAILRVEEPTLSWRVYSIQYHTDRARIDDLEPGSLSKVSGHNPFDQPTNLHLAYSYMEKKSTSWKCGVSFTTGVKTTFEAGVPFVVDGKVELSALVTVSGEWGATEERVTTITGTYDVPVKGGETVELTVRGVHAKCEVPFSYTQEDLHTTGERIVTEKVDGIFRGVNTTDILFDSALSERPKWRTKAAEVSNVVDPSSGVDIIIF